MRVGVKLFTHNPYHTYHHAFHERELLAAAQRQLHRVEDRIEPQFAPLDFQLISLETCLSRHLRYHPEQ